MPNDDYKAKKVNIEEINFEIVVLEMPDNEINDKLTLLTHYGGNITNHDYKDFVIMNFIVNINQLIYYINNNTSDLKDFDSEAIKDRIVSVIYECNESLKPENLVINKNHVVKIKTDGVDDSAILITENKYWDVKKASLTSKPVKDTAKKKAPKPPKKNGEDVDVFNLNYEIKNVWWSRINQYIRVKRYTDEDIDTILASRYFHNRSNFNNFLLSIALIDKEDLFSILDNLDIPSRVAPPIIFNELGTLCTKVNPRLNFDNAKKTNDDDYDEHDTCASNNGRKKSTMSGYSKKEKKNKKRFKDVEREVLINLSNNMKASLIGQDEAIENITESIQRSSIGLCDPYRPIGSFLFAGRTGVGKTLSTKILANELINDRDNIVTIDCSEFSADHEYAKLIGTPPGYIGHDQGGVLTNALTKNPFSVVVFDEIEKASPKVHELLLQILEEGRLTDGKGVTVAFNEAIVIMTSNVGVSEVDAVKKTVGFGDVAVLTENKKNIAITKALKKKFKPEFLNRIDSIVHFRELNKQDYMRIIDIELHKLNENLISNDTPYKNLRLDFDYKIKNYIYRNGVDVDYGARPIRRCVEKDIATPLAQKILKEDIDPNSLVKVSVYRNKISFDIEDYTEEEEKETMEYMNS